MSEKLGYILDHIYFRFMMALLFLSTFVFYTVPTLIGLPKNTFITNLLFALSVIFLTLFLISVLFLRKQRIPIYEHRRKFLDNNLKYFIKMSKRNVRILNVLFTWFEGLENVIINKIVNENLYFEILLVKRKRKDEDLSYITFRENDEDRKGELKPILNKTLFKIFCFLVDLASTKGIQYIRKFQVKEYDFMPVTTMYIFDDNKLIFGPYIAKNCSDIPLIQLERSLKTSIKNPLYDMNSAFDELMEHYDILSGEKKRDNKEYIETFSYFDGAKNQSVHELIESNVNDIKSILESEHAEYYDYLADIKNKEFDDDEIRILGEDNFEGRFDAVLRDIIKKIKLHKSSHLRINNKSITPPYQNPI